VRTEFNVVNTHSDRAEGQMASSIPVRAKFGKFRSFWKGDHVPDIAYAPPILHTAAYLIARKPSGWVSACIYAMRPTYVAMNYLCMKTTKSEYRI